MAPPEKPLTAKGQQLARLLKERIVFLDGAMGTMIQQHALEEEDFRDASLADASGNLKGNNDLLSITRPEIIEDIHRAFLEAGSDIIETNTFSGTTIAQADYGLESRVRDINLHAARLARKVADAVAEKEGPSHIRGRAIGPPTAPPRCRPM
jgi:5-methyltetrahydrofolate--homocysteine methyltransferase